MPDIIRTHEAFVTTALHWVSKHHLPDATQIDAVVPATNLFETGTLDSLAFVELVSFLHERVGRAPDLLNLAPELFPTIDGLSVAFGFSSPLNGSAR